MVLREVCGRVVVVTGGGGLIGRRVAQVISEEGGTPVCVVHSDNGRRGNAYGDTVEVDLAGAPDLVDVMREADYVVHLAARSGGRGFQSRGHAEVFWDNHKMTRQVLDAAAETDVRRVFVASSAVVYRDEGVEPIREDSGMLRAGSDTISGYAWSKITDEVLGAWTGNEGGAEVVVGRFTNVYGVDGVLRRDPSTVVHALIRRAFEAGEQGELPVWGDGTEVRSFLHAEDAASAVMKVVTEGDSGTTYNVDGDEAVTIKELAELVREEVDPTLRIRFLPRYGGGARSRVLDARRLRGLGFVPRYSLREGVGEVVRRCREEWSRSGLR